MFQNKVQEYQCGNKNIQHQGYKILGIQLKITKEVRKWNPSWVIKSIRTDTHIRIKRQRHSTSFIITFHMFKKLGDMKDKNNQNWVSELKTTVWDVKVYI